MSEHPIELIGAYADGELTPQEAARLEAHLGACTECTRELALIRSIGGALQQLRDQPPRQSMWKLVERRITQPLGWILIVAGVAVWIVLGLMEWFRRGELSLEWLATTAVGIGFALLLVGVGIEQYREWRTSPYKDLQR